MKKENYDRKDRAKDFRSRPESGGERETMTEEIRADERANVNAEWGKYIAEAREKNPYQGVLVIGNKREKATWKHCRNVWENALNAILEAMNDKLLSGDSSNAPGVLPDGKGITGHKGESQLTGQSRGGEVVDLYIHAVLRAYALGYAGRARLAERMNGDSVLKVPRGGLIE